MENGYIACYESKRAEIYAETAYAAFLKAVKVLGVPITKRGLLSVVLAEKGGGPVLHDGASIAPY